MAGRQSARWPPARAESAGHGLNAWKAIADPCAPGVHGRDQEAFVDQRLDGATVGSSGYTELLREHPLAREHAPGLIDPRRETPTDRELDVTAGLAGAPVRNRRSTWGVRHLCASVVQVFQAVVSQTAQGNCHDVEVDFVAARQICRHQEDAGRDHSLGDRFLQTAVYPAGLSGLFRIEQARLVIAEVG